MVRKEVGFNPTTGLVTIRGVPGSLDAHQYVFPILTTGEVRWYVVALPPGATEVLAWHLLPTGVWESVETPLYLPGESRP